MDPLDEELAALLAGKTILRPDTYQYFVLSNGASPMTARIWVSREATMTPQEISDQLGRVGEFVLRVGKRW